MDRAGFEPLPLPDVVVRRARLEARLDTGTLGPLTLVSSPAGTGKTLLVSSWAARTATSRHVVWVALRDASVGPERFWQLVVAGLVRRDVELLPLPSAGPAVGDAAYVASMAEALRGGPEPVVLVLDCDGVLTREVTDGLDALMQRAGDRLRVVLLTREDPLLPLHRYRLAGTLTELRMADLGFTRDEALELLSGLGVDLSERATDAVIARTQGWVAGLRMAALSLVHQADREAAAFKLAGDTGTVAEYLMAEVLDTQPPGMRALLLDTSVVEVLRPGLASALAGPHADRALSFLVHGNVFLEELREGGGYHYHELFRQLLRAQLAYESPGRWVELHKVAAAWFAAHDLVGEAARHAALVDEWELAARYVVDDLAVGSILAGRPREGLGDVLRQLPRSADGTAVRVVTAARAVERGDLKGAAAALRGAKERLDAAPESWPAAELATAVVELVLARKSGDWPGAVVAAAAAQRLLQMQDFTRVAGHPEIAALVTAHLGAALVHLGQLDAAAEVLAPFDTAAELSGLERVHSDALGHSALLAAWRGDLTRGASLAVRVVRLSSTSGPPQLDCPAAAEVVLAYVDTERYDLAGARQHAELAAAFEPPASDPLLSVMFALARARVMHAGGDLQGAERVLDGLLDGGLPPWLRDEAEVERASAVRHGTEPAEGDPHLSQLSLRHGRNAVCARVTTLLQSAIEALRSGHQSTALRDLDRALRLAAPEQSRRAFREAPEELWQLLRNDHELWSRHAWLTERRPGGGRHVPQARSTGSHGVPSDDTPQVYEHLTDKEREVLGHLAELLTTEEIAAVMFISVNTVRTHVRNILRKLAASRRNEAVRRARDLKLIRG